MYAYCQDLALVDLSKAKSIKEIQEILSKEADKTPKGEWVKGVNFDQTKFENPKMPTRFDLDEISKDHPIAIRRVCLHTMVVNSKALDVVGIDRNFQDEEGNVERFQENEPTGVLREKGLHLVEKYLSDPLSNLAKRDKIFRSVFKDMSSKGLTSIHTYGAKLWRFYESPEIYERYDDQGNLPLRVTVSLDELFEVEELKESQKKNPYIFVQQGTYKLYVDGSLGSESAVLYEPYEGTEETGSLLYTKEELEKEIEMALKNNLQLSIPSIGDKALDIVLTAIEGTIEKTGIIPEKPIVLIHVQLTPEHLIERMKKLPVLLNIEPIFLKSDMHWIVEKIGEERAKYSYTWKTLRNAGLNMIGASNCPVEDYDPIRGIFMASNRCDWEDKDLKTFYKEESLSVFDAVSMFTKNPHMLLKQCDKLGLIKEDYFADFVILNKDIFEIDPKDILDVKVDNTYLAGKRVFKREDSK